MKKSELKSIIKPLVKECIAESLLEEGLLSNVISEVMKGMSPVITVGSDSFGGVDLFEGTAPAPAQQSPESQASSPLGGIAPGDPGVDISGILGLGGHKWKSLI